LSRRCRRCLALLGAVLRCGRGLAWPTPRALVLLVGVLSGPLFAVRERFGRNTTPQSAEHPTARAALLEVERPVGSRLARHGGEIKLGRAARRRAARWPHRGRRDPGSRCPALLAAAFPQGTVVQHAGYTGRPHPPPRPTKADDGFGPARRGWLERVSWNSGATLLDRQALHFWVGVHTTTGIAAAASCWPFCAPSRRRSRCARKWRRGWKRRRGQRRQTASCGSTTSDADHIPHHVPQPRQQQQPAVCRLFAFIGPLARRPGPTAPTSTGKQIACPQSE
jgi:hypothetical protein